MIEKIKNKLGLSYVDDIDMGIFDEYVNFCLSNSTTKVKFQTQNHHILPKSIFPEFKNLSEHQWNSVTLTNEKHLEAHKLIYQAFPHFNNLRAFIFLNDVLKINQDDYVENRKLFGKLQSKFMLEEITHEGIKITRGKMIGRKISETVLKKMIIDGQETTIAKKRGGKISKKLNKTIIVNGKETTVAKERGKKSAETARKKIILNGVETSIGRERNFKAHETIRNTPGAYERKNRKTQESLDRVIYVDGIKTTPRKEGNKKRNNTLKNNPEIMKNRSKKTSQTVKSRTKEERDKISEKISKSLSKTVKYEGREMTVSELSGIKISNTKRKNGKRYSILRNDKVIYENISYVEVRNISQSLAKTNENQYLGKSRESKLNLNRHFKLHLIGLYVKPL